MKSERFLRMGSDQQQTGDPAAMPVEPAAEKHFQVIRDEVSRSVVFVVVMAIALAAAVAGIAVQYIPRRGNEGGR